MKDSFLEYIKDQFSVLGIVSFKKMFGGVGIYYEGIFFAFLDEDRLFLKVDDTNRADFEEAGMEAFVYEGKKKPVTMSYYQAPEEVVEDPLELAVWSRKSIFIAEKSKKK